MTKVLVHGNPETADIWGPLIAELADRGVTDVITVSPPGFGAPVPAGWTATPAAYVEWLARELRAMEGPIDLLGHDWGAGHVIGLAAAHPELIRSWAADCGGLLNPDYEWHEAAQGWQTEGVGEEMIAAMLAPSAADRAAMFQELTGVGADIAMPLAEAFDDTMGDCILKLYRAAAQPALRELADRLEAAEQRPSLLVDATADAYVPSELVPAVVQRFGCQVLTLADQGHWWMLSSPDAAAVELATFWQSLDA